MNKFIILSLFLALVASQTYSITSCTCAQLLSEGDCIKNASLGCAWDATKKACAVSTTPVTPTVTYAAYCDTFAETDCPKAKPCTDCGSYAACAWTDSKCTYFTGCTAFAKTLDSECQAISNRCITDGTHCVEIDACSTYKKQLPCVKNTAGSLCYWDTTNNTCVDANTCDKLPATFATDKECRDVISTCTTKTGGGCVDSGNNCSDQTLEIQCVWNKLKTTACYWDGAACKDRICDNAPTSLTTDDACKTFRTDGTCTTKANGGCVTRTTCAAAAIQASCIKNSSGGDCYWTGTACVDKTCANAPVTMTTNSACAGFVTGCITKSGGGCVANGACSVANVQAACVKNSSNFDCIWDTTCKEKTCANAPTTNNTHDLCTSYLSTCTVKSGGGCQNRTCANAPTTLTTNDACEAYLTGNNCITKTGGGCVTNTTCAAITLEAACVKNSTGSTCFWDTASSSCKDKICVNAPATNTTHDLCQAFLNTCTVNSTSAGCVEKTCENSLVLAICDKDTSNRACIWKGKCYKKQCVLASSATTTHADCQTYHSSCTLSNQGTGCVPLPLKCEAITLEAACNMKANGQPCGWNGSQCIDKACSTASKTFATTTQCQGHISTCVANNPATVNGSLTIQGCQDLPTTCAARKSTENCEISRAQFPTCLWVASSTSCVEKSCATASTAGTTGALSAGGFTFSACQAYLNTCISNNTADGCMVKPSSCSSLVSSNCQLGSKASGDCYWNGSSCVDRTCANITQTTHNSCQSTFNQCTVNNGGTACQPLATACTSYSTQENCKFTSTNKNCVWTGLACRNATCADAPDTASYDTDTECLAYPTPSETCTVVYKVGAQGCVPKSANCSDYMTQAQCHKTITNLTANDDCKWVVDRCYAISSFATGACTTFKGTQTMCQGYRAGCTNTGGATSSTACTLDCTLKTGTGLTFADCQALDSTCSVKKDGTGCIVIQSACTGYGTTAANCFRSSASGNAGYCALNGSSTCVTVSAAADCAFVTGLTGLDHTKCQLYHTSCTALKDGTGCQEYKTTCSGYAATNNCATSGQGKCYFDGTDCLRFTNCASVTGTGLTTTICATYDAGCIANVDGTACQEKLATCDLYLTQKSCSTSAAAATADKCAWSGTACLAIVTANIATHCAYVTGTGLTDAICAAYNVDCTANRAGTACQEQKATCDLYTTEATCSTSAAAATADKCAWSGTACLAVTTVATHCAYVTGTGLVAATCAAYNVGCINLKDGTGCQEAKAGCKDYSTQNKCSAQSTGSLSCIWVDSSCYTLGEKNCSSITGTGLDHAQCQSYSAGCTSITDGTKCQDLKSSCEQYAGTTASCTKTATSKCYLQGSTCITISNVATDCAKITGGAGTVTYDICQSYNTGCSANRARSACVQQQAQCSGYTVLTSCYKSGAGLCIASTNTDTACVAASSATTCDAVYLGTGNYSNANCVEMKAGCTNNGTTACVAKSCANAAGITFNHANCNSYLNTCTVNSGGTACQTMIPKCADQTSTACLYSVEGECVVIGTSCVRKTCDTAAIDATRDDDSECSTYQQSCTVARLGACQARAACGTYKSSLQCKFNTSGGKCFWNPTNKTCVDLNCGNIETSTSFDTHNECVAVDSTLACTVRATNGAAVQGCMARGACASYTIEEQCKTNASNGICVWNTNANLPAPACQDKSCTSAPTSTTTHNDCYAYYNTATVKCTVVATPSNSGGNPTLGGCQQTAACSSYIDKEQCQINANGDPCGWNGTQCADKACSTAPATTDYDDDTKCRAYLSNKCTVSDIGLGCVEIPATCETMTQKQCYSNKAGDPCYWTGTTCITKSCDNAPDATATADECNTYLAGCTLDNVKCKTKVCEDFAFATDALCKQAISTCTTNGTNCVTRGTCFQALSQAGCVSSTTGQQCEWIPAVLNASNVVTTPAYCTIKNCSTAPITLTSEAACAGYFTNCTTKNGGGCVTKSTCAAVTIDVACTTALNGTICAWDSAQNKCRDKDCQDFSGTTHAACQAQRAGCTAGASGKCARVQNCEQTQVRSACIEGTNGPCLWIDKYVNTDGSKGACFRYTSCKSLAWNSDTSCKWISNKCTTNGSNCVGITLCSETNTDGGCVTGYDGACIQSVPALNSSDPKVCKPYISCADAFYTTHSDCQIASSKCTTNGTTGCIALGSCSSYTAQAGCYFNDKGAQYSSGAIVSTGVCTWDTISSSCRDQSCADLTGTTHATCSSQLSTCTSDGTTCLLKGVCTSYTTQIACTTAVGSDGSCYWELASATNNNTAKCRLLTCADIQNGTATNVCSVALSTCVSNGTACIPKANCSTYTSKTACNSGGLDGICVFTQSTATGAAAGTGTCALMTACTIANNDQTACQAARDRCAWTAASGTGTTAVASKCATHTCATNQATNGACTRFLNWDKKTQQICTLVSGACTATDPSTLSTNDCFLVSGYTYTWNASTSKCGVCTAVVVQPNNSNNDTNNTDNNTTTDSGYILGLSVVLGYLMF